MKTLTLILLLVFTTTLSACNQEDKENIPIEMDNTNQKEIKLIIGTTTFDVTLANNTTAEAFISLLPTNIVMHDLYENEKYYNLPQNLPSQPERVNTIHKGDIMLFGSNTLVVFYKTFNTSYSYTPIGRISNSSDLETILGIESVKLTFKLSEK